MKISFSIPAYNEEAAIGRCLDSIFAQVVPTGSEIEIVVVNNASQDRTKEIAASYLGVRVVDEPQKGLTHARAAGVRATDGEIIANVDADTMLTHGWIAKVVKEFSANPQLVALSGPFIYYDLPYYDRVLTRFFYALGYVSHHLMHSIFHKGAMLQGGNFVIRREALEKIGGFDTTIAFYGEDTDIACRLATVGKVKWTWGFPMNTSGRRLKKEGIVTMGLRYTINHFAIIFFKRPATQHYTDIRLP